jgi:HEAT repeat protein
VRKQAIRQFEGINGEVIKWLFILTEDPDESIRNMVLRKLGRDRNQVAEELLLNYLETRQYTITNHQHLLACYRALGRCGSHRCIPFLKKLLFTKGWFLDLGKSVHRIGATVALFALETKEAKEILQKASGSFLPAVRLAYRKALEVNR